MKALDCIAESLNALEQRAIVNNDGNASALIKRIQLLLGHLHKLDEVEVHLEPCIITRIDTRKAIAAAMEPEEPGVDKVPVVVSSELPLVETRSKKKYKSQV